MHSWCMGLDPAFPVLAHLHMLSGLKGGLKDNGLQGTIFMYTNGTCMFNGIADLQFKNHEAAEEYLDAFALKEEYHDGYREAAGREQAHNMGGKRTTVGARPYM